VSRILTRYNDFTKGEAGWSDKNRIAPGYFDGESVQVYRDGTLGPRSGIVDLAPTAWPAGTIFDMGYVDTGNNGDEYLWVRKGTALARVRVYQQTGTLAKVVSAQAFSTDATAFTSAQVGDYVDYEKAVTLFTISGDKCYKAVWTNAVGTWLSAIAGSPGGRCCELYGDFFVVGNVSGHTNRLVFSAAANYASWPAANFLDLGNAGNAGTGGAPTITAIRKVKDQLLVFADTGQMWVITGTLGANEVVREFMPGDKTNGPGTPKALARDRAGGLWWTRREDIVAEGETWDSASAMPVSYLAGVRGEVPVQAGYLRQPTFSSNRTSDTIGFTPRNDKSAVLMDRAPGGEMRALIYRDGVWTRHRLEFDTTTTILASTPGSRGDVYMAMLNASSNPVIYAWQAEYEVPPVKFVTNTLLLPLNTVDHYSDGSDSPIDAWCATAEFRAPDYGMVTVERIELLYTAYPLDGVTPSAVAVYLQQYEQAGAQEKGFTIQNPDDYDVTTGNYTPPFGVTIPMNPPIADIVTSMDRMRRRVALYPESGQGKPTPSFRILLKGMFNLKIHEIVVFGESNAADRR
jgi:hypothetical protein